MALQEGMKVIRKEDSYKEARNFYAKNAYTTHLDEIFNEDEALKVTGVDKPQIQYDMGNGFSKKVYNYQSSNYKITSYGRMMKIVMGDNLTFKAMYEDSIVAYHFFDQFKDVSDKVYQGKPPMFNVLNSLNEIKNKSSLVESQKLDLFLTECLQRRVSHDLNNQNISLNDISGIKMYVDEFTNYMTKNPDMTTKQDYIILEIKKHIIEKENLLKNNNINNTIEESVDESLINSNNNIESNFFHHPKASELNELEKQKQIAKRNNDIKSYNLYKAKIEEIIKNNRIQVTSQHWNSMTIQEQIMKY